MGTMPDGTRAKARTTARTAARAAPRNSTTGSFRIRPFRRRRWMSPSATPRTAPWTPAKIALWAAIALLGGVAWFMLAIVRGETVNAIWFVFAVGLHLPDRLPLLLQGH